jgi:hypothetical protein
MAQQVGAFTVDRAKEVSKATDLVLNVARGGIDNSRMPTQVQPVYRVKITGAADGDGVYPAVLLILNPTTLAWTELGDCYAYKVDTI